MQKNRMRNDRKANSTPGKFALILFTTVFSVGAGAADPLRSISVSGDCVRAVTPDRAGIVLTVEVKDKDGKKAQVSANRIYEALRGKVLGLKLPDANISTAEYLSEEIREWEKERMVSRGYHTRISLRVETSDVTRLNEAIEAAAREGVTQMGSLQQYLSPNKILSEKMACLQEAATQARSKAEALAKTLGARLGEVVTIQEGNASVPDFPHPMGGGMSASASMREKSAPTIEAGRSDLSTSVQLVFSLK